MICLEQQTNISLPHAFKRLSRQEFENISYYVIKGHNLVIEILLRHWSHHVDINVSFQDMEMSSEKIVGIP